MSTTETDIEVDLDAVEAAEAAEAAKKDAPEPETKIDEPKSEPKADKTVLTPDEGIKKLQAQLENEKQARLEAERRAREAAEGEARAKNKVQSTELDFVKSGIASLTAANDALEEKYAAALSTQDYAGAAKVQRELAANEAKLVELERAKTNMEKAPAVMPRVADDPVERLCAQLTPQSAAWVRAHPEYARDPAKYRKMLGAHELAMGDGFKPDSPEYFAAVEDTLKIAPQRQEVRMDTDPTADAARPSASRPSRQAAPPSAPVSRSGNGTGGNRANVVTLTPEQVEIAQMMKMTPEEYAKQVVALKREGKLN
jgi:hypothetical protein